MTQGEFLRRREADWDRMEQTVALPVKRFKERAGEFPAEFRRLTQDLNTVSAENYDPLLTERLNRLVLDAHRRLYGIRNLRLAPLLQFAAVGFPRAVRREWRLLVVFLLFFFLIGLATGLLVNRDPERLGRWFSWSVALGLEQMYDPEAEAFLQPRETSGSADMFGFYVYNNISIAFRTFAGGLLAGVGSLIFFLYNAVFLGAAAGYISALGYHHTFFPFVIGHSAFEMTALVFCAGAGWKLGFSVLAPPSRKGRLAHLKDTGRAMMPLIYGSVLFLVVAAGLEAFWSSAPLEPSLKYAVGGVLWLLVLLYFLLAGRSE